MSHHAGFATAATVTEETVNDVAAAYLRGLGPLFFPLPTIVVGLVRIWGLLRVLPLRIELHANPADQVLVHFGFRGRVHVEVAGQGARIQELQLEGTVALALLTAVQNDQVFVGINSQSLEFLPLRVRVLEGRLSPVVVATLEAPELAASASAFVRSLPTILVSPPLLAANLDFPYGPRSVEGTNFSVFNWFTVKLSASRIVAKPLEQAITVAVDFEGYTSGISNQLVDVTRRGGAGHVYRQEVTPATNPKSDPMPWKSYRSAGRPAVAVCVNLGFLADVVARQISPQVADTPVTKDVTLRRVEVGYSVFHQPLREDQDGLVIRFFVTVFGVGVSGRIFLQPFLTTFDGFIDPPHDFWQIYTAKAEVDVPWWVDLLPVAFAMGLSVSFPMMAPLLGFGAAAAISQIHNEAENAETETQKRLKQLVLPRPWHAPLPGLTRPNFDGRIKYSMVTPDAVELAIDTWVAWSDRDPEPLASIVPLDWPAGDRAPIPVRLELSDEFRPLGGPNLTLTWEVLRSDTGEVVLTGTSPYSNPAGNGVSIPHHSRELYQVDEFVVRSTASLTLGSQGGVIWSGERRIAIRDALDRKHKFVRWGPRWVHFQNDGTENEWWHHYRASRIHRTAVSARCRMLGEAIWLRRSFEYFDALPIDWASLNRYRKSLCDYCFFGGPDKQDPFPEEDWF